MDDVFLFGIETTKEAKMFKEILDFYIKAIDVGVMKISVGPRPSFEETLVTFDHLFGLRRSDPRWTAQAALKSRDIT